MSDSSDFDDVFKYSQLSSRKNTSVAEESTITPPETPAFLRATLPFTVERKSLDLTPEKIHSVLNGARNF